MHLNLHTDRSDPNLSPQALPSPQPGVPRAVWFASLGGMFATAGAFPVDGGQSLPAQRRSWGLEAAASLVRMLGLRDRAQAVVFAYESGLITPGHHNIGH